MCQLSDLDLRLKTTKWLNNKYLYGPFEIIPRDHSQSRHPYLEKNCLLFDANDREFSSLSLAKTFHHIRLKLCSVYEIFWLKKEGKIKEKRNMYLFYSLDALQYGAVLLNLCVHIFVLIRFKGTSMCFTFLIICLAQRFKNSCASVYI